MDLRANHALPLSVFAAIRDLTAKDSNGHRRVICRPPVPRKRGEDDPLNPLTRKSNRDMGIKWQRKAVYVPFPVKTPVEIKAPGEKVLEGRTLHLSDGKTFDGAAWDVCRRP